MIASFCADCKIPFSPHQIATSSAKAGCLKDILEKNGVDSISALRELVKDVDLFIACDKGNSRKGINSFVKYICGWDEKRKRVVKYVLDIDVADGKSADAADAIDDSLSKIDQPGRQKRKLVGQGSDAGGGGVGRRLFECLKKKGRTEEHYLIATCLLHGWQCVLGNAIEACSGSGGLLKRDVLQMIHTVYQIQGEYEIEEFKGMWRLVSGKEFQTMPKPNIGRWGSVGDAGDNLLERWEDWQAMAVSIINNCNTDINANTFASWADLIPFLELPLSQAINKSTFSTSSRNAKILSTPLFSKISFKHPALAKRLIFDVARRVFCNWRRSLQSW
jgi:hypothetical protein